MNLVRIGRELAERGHTFSMLISQFDSIGAETLDARTFSGLHVITFDGPPGIGTEAWASNFSRDPQKVDRGRAVIMIPAAAASCLTFWLTRT